MRTGLVAIIITSISLSSALAESTYTTRRSDGTKLALFTQVQHGKFGKVWKDENDFVWSANQGFFYNNPHPPFVLATKACDELGGRVPNVSQFIALRSQFELTADGNHFTAQGQKDFQTLFPDLAAILYAPSCYDVCDQYPNDSAFDGNSGYIFGNFPDYGYEGISVVCMDIHR